MPKLALIGYGKMGRAVEEAARDTGWEVTAHFDRSHPLRADAATRRALADAEVGVDFSVPRAVTATVAAAADLGLPLVIGTTGWQEQAAEVAHRAEHGGLPVLHAPNFSLGVLLFFRAVEHAATLFAHHPCCEPYLEEAHHRDKEDQPSGTARELLRILEEAAPSSSPSANIPVSCLRAGSVVPLHRVGFDTPAETVTLIHRTKNRRGYADGALIAARWLLSHPTPGLTPFDVVITEMLHETALSPTDPRAEGDPA